MRWRGWLRVGCGRSGGVRRTIFLFFVALGRGVGVVDDWTLGWRARRWWWSLRVEDACSEDG